MLKALLVNGADNLGQGRTGARSTRSMPTRPPGRTSGVQAERMLPVPARRSRRRDRDAHADHERGVVHRPRAMDVGQHSPTDQRADEIGGRAVRSLRPGARGARAGDAAAHSQWRSGLGPGEPVEHPAPAPAVGSRRPLLLRSAAGVHRRRPGISGDSSRQSMRHGRCGSRWCGPTRPARLARIRRWSTIWISKSRSSTPARSSRATSLPMA